MERRTWQLLSVGSLAGIGGLTLVGHLVHLFEEAPVVAILTGVLPPMIVSVGLLVAAWVLSRQDLGDRCYRRVFVWTLLGLLVLTGLGTSLVVYQLAHGATLYDGSFIVVNWVATGALIGSLVGFYDADRLQKEAHLRRERDRLREREAQLERENERLEQFASIVSHDIRNPLNVASGHLELAREADAPAEHLDAIGGAHDRIGTIVDEILTLAREGDPVRDGAREIVSLERIAEEAWATVDTADATLSVEAGGSLLAHEERVRRILENCFKNAIEHGGSSVTVGVGWVEDGDGFFVEDDGPGVAGDLDLFEAGVTTESGGTGLGLAIVKRAVEAHGWTITECGGPDCGARFEIRGVERADEGCPRTHP